MYMVFKLPGEGKMEFMKGLLEILEVLTSLVILLVLYAAVIATASAVIVACIFAMMGLTAQ